MYIDLACYSHLPHWFIHIVCIEECIGFILLVQIYTPGCFFAFHKKVNEKFSLFITKMDLNPWAKRLFQNHFRIVPAFFFSLFLSLSVLNSCRNFSTFKAKLYLLIGGHAAILVELSFYQFQPTIFYWQIRLASNPAAVLHSYLSSELKCESSLFRISRFQIQIKWTIRLNWLL